MNFLKKRINIYAVKGICNMPTKINIINQNIWFIIIIIELNE
jgi:hypothetical protein